MTTITVQDSIETQINLETQAQLQARVNKTLSLHNSFVDGHFSDTELSHILVPMYDQVEELILQKKTSKFTNNAVKSTKDLGPVICDYILNHANASDLAAIVVNTLADAVMSEGKGLANFTMLALNVGKQVELNYYFDTFIEANKVKNEKVFDTLQKLFLSDTPFGMDKAIASLKKFMSEKIGFEGPDDWEALAPGHDWGTDTNTKYVKLGGWLIDQALNVDTPWFALKSKSTKEGGNTIVVATEEFQILVTNSRHYIVTSSFMKLPMIQPPVDWSVDGSVGGYHLNGHAFKLPLMLSRSGKAQTQPNSLAVEMVNNAQQVGWCINTDVTNVANQLVTEGITLGTLIVPTKDAPGYAKFQAIRNGHASRKSLEYANQFAAYEAFYMPHCMDWRGRVYQANTVLNVQSTDFGKSLLKFAQSVPVTEQAIKELAVHLANVYGMDKLPAEQKIAWVEEHSAAISAVASDPIHYAKAWADGSMGDAPNEPWQFIAACVEYNAVAIAKTKDTTNLPVASDATCSGVQHLAALLKDPKSAKLVNLMGGPRQDLYMECANLAPSFVDDINYSLEGKKSQLKADDLEYVKQLISGPKARTFAKPVVMTTGYNGTVPTQVEKVLELCKELGIDLTWMQAYVLVASLRTALFTVAPALNAMKTIQKYVKEMAEASNCEIIEWETTPGFVVRQVKPKLDAKKLRVGGKQVVVYEPDPFGKCDANGHGTSIVPNFVHGLDATLLHLTFAKYTSAFGLIHDSVLTLPGQMEGTINKLKATFVDMYSEDVFAKWWKQIGLDVLDEDGHDLLQMVIDQGLITMGDFDINQVMDSEYFFS